MDREKKTSETQKAETSCLFFFLPSSFFVWPK